ITRGQADSVSVGRSASTKNKTMKKLLVLAFSLAVVSTCIPAAFGADTADTAPAATKPVKKKTHQTEDQRKLRKEMVDKYDTNKDGKLDKEERSKISKEDREKMK